VGDPAWFGTIDEIGERFAQVPGLFDPVVIRAQDPHGAYSGPMLALLRGRYPVGRGEVAITDAVAQALTARVGTQISLDGRTRTVVGLVENPSQLDDEFALVDSAYADPPQSVTVLVGGSKENLEAFRSTIPGAVVRDSRQDNPRTAMALIVMALAAVGLLLVSLVAAAGFVVAAQRRMRQLGMLAAIGATQRHLRLVMLANGAVVGAIAAVTGTALGVVAWLAVATRVEVAAGHRIDRFDLPWAVLGAGILLAVATATAAAWWPARVVARTPVMSALSARPPGPSPARRSTVLAAILLVAGPAAVFASRGTNPVLILGGGLITTIGMLFLGPLAIRALAAGRAHLPVPVRLALTDLVRYQARSGAALAAISLALGISAAIVVGTASADYTARRDAGLGNLADSQLIVRIGQPAPIMPERTPAETAAFQKAADAIAASLGGSSSVIGLDMAVVTSYKDMSPKGQEGHPIVEMGIKLPDRSGDSSYPLYVATPDVLRLYGLELAATAPDVDLLSVHLGELKLNNIPERNVSSKTQLLGKLDYSSLPDTLITPAAVGRHGWEVKRVGWFIRADHPLTAQQLATAQSLAVNGGLTMESRRERASLASLQNGAAGAGALLALAVLASTVGLIRSEAANDLRTGYWPAANQSRSPGADSTDLPGQSGRAATRRTFRARGERMIAHPSRAGLTAWQPFSGPHPRSVHPFPNRLPRGVIAVPIERKIDAKV
jgi:putative ABC transport system permease protein